MKYAEVAVNSPIARRRTFCYSIPPYISVTIGHGVWVPFGPKVLQGIVVSLSQVPSVDVTKEIISLISFNPLLSPIQVTLALWLSEYYLAPLFDAVALMLPPGFERKLVTMIQLLPLIANLTDAPAEQAEIMQIFKGKTAVRLSEIEKKLGKRKSGLLIKKFVDGGLLVKTDQLEDIRVKPKLARYVKLEIDRIKALEESTKLRQKKAFRQAEVIELLSKYSEPILLEELRKHVPCPNSLVEVLKGYGMISILETQVRRDPLQHYSISPDVPPMLTDSQIAALRIISSCSEPEGATNNPCVFLLAGITGSGKTEIYIRALEEVVARGKKGICLVPEIALTPQTIDRFAKRFPGRVAVFHSGLSLGEQFDEWGRIQKGECDVVIGTRSALFVPLPDLGLIILDEEHEWTYKQVDKSPRYHARETAIKLAALSGCSVILGSATPDVESFYKAQNNIYQLVELKERITPGGISPLPEVETIDMRDELKSGNYSLFSRSLLKLMDKALARSEQVMLFLNRRGSANFMQCQICGFVPYCPRCLVSLIYHSVEGKLVCHHCNYKLSPLQVCPRCSSPRLKYFGIGTQKVEQETQRLFPEARTLRWDRDVTSTPGAHKDIMVKFRDYKADVLIGTQMIAKGLDLPRVTVAGVINADIGLNLPDFRAGERTFQLVCQFAGRAGRGFLPGKVIIQTFCADHYAIKAASKQDYLEFYRREINYRKQFGYPPLKQLARLVYWHTSPVACRREVEKMYQFLKIEKDRKGIVDLRFIGPAPNHVSRVRGRFLWQIVLCGTGLSQFLSDISFPRGWVVDIDPVTVI